VYSYRETREKSNYLLSKAQMQMEEQEDDIKHLNELMLYAKCVSIRDKQVEQKVNLGFYLEINCPSKKGRGVTARCNDGT
jgi:hypothetical protein